MTVRRARSLSVLGTLAAGAIGLIASTQTWFDVILRDAPDSVLAVSGAAAVPVLAPLCLAALALGAALSIAGRVLSYVFGLLTLLLGIALNVLIWPIALTHPVSAVASTVTTATGIEGHDAVAGLIASVAATPWPIIAGITAVLVTVTGAFILVTARGWASSGRRYRTAPATDTATAEPWPAADADRTTLDAVDSWDDLSRGTDPTRGDPR